MLIVFLFLLKLELLSANYSCYYGHARCNDKTITVSEVGACSTSVSMVPGGTGVSGKYKTGISFSKCCYFNKEYIMHVFYLSTYEWLHDIWWLIKQTVRVYYNIQQLVCSREKQLIQRYTISLKQLQLNKFVLKQLQLNNQHRNLRILSITNVSVRGVIIKKGTCLNDVYRRMPEV